MALNWCVCVFVSHGDFCSNLLCVLRPSLISFKPTLFIKNESEQFHRHQDYSLALTTGHDL